MVWHDPKGSATRSIIFPALLGEADLHPLRARRTLYFVTKSSAALAAGSAGLGGSDIAEGNGLGGEKMIVVGRF